MHDSGNTSDVVTPNWKRIFLLSVFILFSYIVVITFLSIAWYDLESITQFHWFDDLNGWMQMDKCGHFYSTFVTTSILYSLWKLTKVNKHKCLIISGLISFFCLSSIELFDGLSKSYGASAWDILANFLGVIFFVIQILFFEKILCNLKFSFHTTVFAQLRKSFFGNTIFQQILKDYNGQTYWYSIELNKIFKSKLLPSFLQVSIGIGADGLLGGDDNIFVENGKTLDFSFITRSRRIAISFDINLENFSHSKFYWLLKPLNYIKFPFPALVFSYENGLKFYWVYF